MKKPFTPQAPTGRTIPAQGKEPRDAALGPPPPQNPSPVGATQLPVGWIDCLFVDVANVISGKNQREVESPSGTYPIYGSGGKFGRATAYLCEAGTTVIGRKGTINSPIFVNERFWNVDTAFGLFPIDPELLEPRLLHYFCRLFDFSALDKSTTIPSLAKRDIETIPFPLPPLNEQKRIVSKIEELFSELDAGEESLRRARRQLGVYRQSLLKQAFEGKLTAPWRAQHPDLLESPDQLLARIQAERQARYQQQLKEWEKAGGGPGKPKQPKPFETIQSDERDTFGVLPNGWTWVRFGNLLSVSSGNGLTASTMDGGEFPVYGGNGISGYHSSYMFEAPTLVIGRVGAKCGITHITLPCSWVTDNALVCDFLAESMSMKFFMLLLNHLDLNKLSVSTAQPVVSGSKLNPLPLPLCSLPEQQEIVRLLDEQFTVIAQNEQEIDAALKRSAALRQSILKKAFTGQLVPQDPTDEPASTLLERIRMERNGMVKKKRASPKVSEVLSSS